MIVYNYICIHNVYTCMQGEVLLCLGDLHIQTGVVKLLVLSLLTTMLLQSRKTLLVWQVLIVFIPCHLCCCFL